VPAGPLGPKCPKCGAHAYLLRSMATRPSGLATPVPAPAVRCGTVVAKDKGRPTFRDKCGVQLLKGGVPAPHRAAPKPRAASKASKGGKTAPKRPARRATPSARSGKSPGARLPSRHAGMPAISTGAGRA